MKWLPIEVYCDLKQCTDSMLFSSETKIAQITSEDKRYKVALSVLGSVRVWYQGEMYHDVSEFPEELKWLFRLGDAYDSNEVDIFANNWYSIDIYENGELIDDDVWEGIPADYTIDELQGILIDSAESCIEYWRD